ncbi:aldehyde dehydrogenase family protein [Streptomyces sp. SAI-127]|uniref:aldehyde dehydrogenase family protein n=1 Tax=Streptomyces sp. SAI-127 TaxID=2940543 RepID=UPI0024747776|nr:aldehyde dehydrogenase family protein [Streptomyces sp. SAI-127]MDH6492290.1 betaine-aldehyde dehydrogenase [Streptomyces sp. SAI-127]
MEKDGLVTQEKPAKTDGTSGEMDTVMLVDPRTGRPRGNVTKTDEQGVAAAVKAARGAQPGWAGTTTGERSRALLRLAALVEARADAYIHAEQAGTGKPRAEAAGEVAQCADLLRFYAGAIRADLTPGSGHRLPHRESWVRWEPLGVVGVIVPWNYPLLMAIWRIAPALAAGNTVVVKPAETTPDSVLRIAEDAEEALGSGVLTVIPGDRETGRLLVRSAVDAVAFTGSQAGGMDVVAAAGTRRVSLELGGNCPAIVLPDAPDHTYLRLVDACLYNAGQSCAAPARIITLRDNYHKVIEGLAAAMGRRRAGVDFGPLNNSQQLDRYDRIIDAAPAGIRHVAEMALADNETEGYWRPGLILADLPDDAPVITEETFGPALTVQEAENEEAAVLMANSLPHALAASVWSTSVGSGLHMARLINAGEVWVNCHLEQTAELPHGGRGQSGHGTDLSVLALTEYQRPKTITVNTG